MRLDMAKSNRHAGEKLGPLGQGKLQRLISRRDHHIQLPHAISVAQQID
jgi:hypothetical protein